jgi:hypothetical protein
MLILVILVGCGAGENKGPEPATQPAPQANNGPSPNEEPNDPEPEAPKPDPDKWRKVKTPAPAGWHKMGKEGRAELNKPDYGLLKAPPAEFQYIAAYADAEAPHASSGTDEQWMQWRENASVVIVYAASKEQTDPLAVLKDNGDKFIEGFVAADANDNPGFAAYTHQASPEKMLAAVSNERGTYILVALARSEAAANVLKQWPKEIQPQ